MGHYMSKITSLGRQEARFLVINDFAKFIEHPVMKKKDYVIPFDTVLDMKNDT